MLRYKVLYIKYLYKLKELRNSLLLQIKKFFFKIVSIYLLFIL